MGVLKPARNEARSNEDSEVLVDLDLVTTKKATFTLHGKTHALLPVTTEVFLSFWQKVTDFKAIKTLDADKITRAYYDAVKTMCESITLDDVKRMTLMQRATLIEALAGKIIGDKTLLERAKDEKKNLITSKSASRLSN